MKRWEIVLAGSGGQGLIVGAILLGTAAAKYGYHVAQTQSYGVAARGGSSEADVVISDESIVYPKAVNPDIVLALTEGAFKKYYGRLKPGAVLLIDTDNVSWQGQEKNVYGLPFTSLARDLGNPGSINICGLGAILGIKEIVPMEVMEETIVNQFAEKYREANLAIFRKGMNLIRK
ncbi:MAG: 2-oxoacid:acceptor oxidoreductase family protein [Bacillota bacterium]